MAKRKMQQKEDVNANVVNDSTYSAPESTIVLNTISIKVKKLVPEAQLPRYMTFSEDGVTPTAIGMDVTATSAEWRDDIKTWVYGTGLAFEVPLGYGMVITPRSSNRKTDYYIPNSPGLLDSGYGKELFVNFKHRGMEDDHKLIAELAEKMKAIETAVVNRFQSGFMAAQLRSISRKYENANCVPNRPYEIGDRIAQIFIIPYPIVKFIEVDEVADTRGGFGSTGSK